MKSSRFLLSVPVLALAMSAMADGNHAGGHEHASEAIGKPGVAARAARTVTVDMSDTMRFSVDQLTVRQGETVRFIVRNRGKVKHEMVLGTEHALREHAELMKKFPGMEHSDPSMITLEPGKVGEIVWQFTRAGKIGFACLQPGHYDAGMKGMVTVAAGQPAVHDQAGTPAKTHATAPAAAMTEGEVRKVDLDGKKITLKHGAIRNLDMPAMTMVFQVSDPAMLTAVKVGDRVRFSASNEAGKLTLTSIQAAK
jgi:uncharacterized cupredoxin-like copper-binding protein